MKKAIILVALVSSSYALSQGNGASSSESFTLNYEVLTGKAVCWQTCRNDLCEEADFGLFFDDETQANIDSASARGSDLKVALPKNLVCSESYASSKDPIVVPYMAQNMEHLQKTNPRKAKQLIEQKGVSFKYVIHNNVSKQIDAFLATLIK